MILHFYRNTHDENGNYRGDEYFGKKSWRGVNTQEELDAITKYNTEFEKSELFFGVHVWAGSGEQYKMTLEEIHESILEGVFDGSFSGSIDTNDPRLTIESTLRSLAFMIEHKLVIACYTVG